MTAKNANIYDDVEDRELVIEYQWNAERYIDKELAKTFIPDEAEEVIEVGAMDPGALVVRSTKTMRMETTLKKVYEMVEEDVKRYADVHNIADEDIMREVVEWKGTKAVLVACGTVIHKAGLFMLAMRDAGKGASVYHIMCRNAPFICRQWYAICRQWYEIGDYPLQSMEMDGHEVDKHWPNQDVARKSIDFAMDNGDPPDSFFEHTMNVIAKKAAKKAMKRCTKFEDLDYYEIAKRTIDLIGKRTFRKVAKEEAEDLRRKQEYQAWAEKEKNAKRQRNE